MRNSENKSHLFKNLFLKTIAPEMPIYTKCRIYIDDSQLLNCESSDLYWSTNKGSKFNLKCLKSSSQENKKLKSYEITMQEFSYNVYYSCSNRDPRTNARDQREVQSLV